MYGTIARMQFKPGAESRMNEVMREYESVEIPGSISTHVYRMDQNPNEFYMVVMFQDRESYRRNAENPAQHQRYLRMMDMLVTEPEWHDGEIVFSEVMSASKSGM